MDIQLGLDRISVVAKKMGLVEKSCPVITVTGTNGKGSCVATLEAIYLAAGYRVGVFQSPYLWKPEEQIRFQGQCVESTVFQALLKEVESECDEVKLTAFEMTTLAALLYFRASAANVIVLEVGMGGRRDAVNVIDPDLAIITNVALEHTQWLGQTREEIAHEKAGILREGVPLVYGEMSVPEVVSTRVKNCGVTMHVYSQEYEYIVREKDWVWCSDRVRYALSVPQLAIHNVSMALMAVECLQVRLPVTVQAIQEGVQCASLPGRYQKILGTPQHIYDVAHNPAGAVFLADQIQRDDVGSGKTIAVFSMLQDKNIAETIAALKSCVAEWHIAVLETPRAASLSQLETAMIATGVKCYTAHASLKAAHQAAMQSANAEDRILVCGSFYTVSALLNAI